MLHGSNTSLARPPSRPRRNHDRPSGRPQGPSIMRKIRVSDGDSAIRGYLSELGTPRALTVWLLYSHGEHRQLVELGIDPLRYENADLFRRDYAATKFLSKCVGLKTGINLEEVAISTAFRAEALCQQTNKRIIEYRSGSVRNPEDAVWYRASQIISRILGPLPQSFEDDQGWSRGRSSSAYGTEVNSVYKYTSRLDVTWSARTAALAVLRDSPSWGAAALAADGPCSALHSALSTVEGNTMITVPKNAKTDRVICYEPHMNIRLQRSVGAYISKRLRANGVNLSDQSVNQRRAKLASKTGHLATIDLSMASDTLSRELVFELLPIDWALKLDDLRSKYTLWPDMVQRQNHKFSSMGNGFTFEVESLIFYALCCAVSTNVSVYGDDIILPTTDFDRAKSALESAGFLFNESKSFSHGHFRESCGMDAFRGVDCTPVYLRSLPKRVEDIVKLHNAVRAWCERGSPLIAFERLMARWRSIHTCVLGPSGYGDGHYHVDFDRAAPHRASDGIDGWWFRTFIRTFRVNSLYGDRVSGRFSDRYSWGALCASLGPKGTYRVIDSSTDRRLWKYVNHRGLASFTWPTIVWV